MTDVCAAVAADYMAHVAESAAKHGIAPELRRRLPVCSASSVGVDD